jgi:DNA gyrase/topoisomerase IV subunit B
VAWNWKAGNATLGTGDFTQGTIASTCSRNVDAGFSIVSYTGAGGANAGKTVGHGLSAKPEMIIIKNRTSSSKNWYVYHEDLHASSPEDYRVLLNTTAAASSNTTGNSLQGTAPTNSLFTLGNGTQIAGNDLAELVENTRRVNRVLAHVSNRYNKELIEELAVLSALSEDVLVRGNGAEAALAKVTARLNARAGVGEDNWTARSDDEGDGVVFVQEIRGIKDVYRIDAAFIASPEARKLNEAAAERAQVFETTSVITRKEESHDINLPSELLTYIIKYGRKGLAIQRYKGLGEMNPGQLWETTLDPDARSLLKVKVDHADTADEIFSKLMGDVVEPRREFIQDNALSVANLDV